MSTPSGDHQPDPTERRGRKPTRLDVDPELRRAATHVRYLRYVKKVPISAEEQAVIAAYERALVAGRRLGL